MTTLFDQTPPEPPAPPRSNVPELSVSELAFALRRTLEDGFARVRVRGELSGLKIPSSGHLYADLKDAESCLSVICWKSTLSRLKLKPEDGLEVICTGKITTYPKSSRYQLIVDSIELAGAGALLKMLEDRRRKYETLGYFNPERKKTLPFLPEVIGVVTSPTGAVIRDILHRLEDRFPRHVLVWPVRVQGDGAAAEIAAAINGFNALGKTSTIPVPDVIIVARGGGSLEDLMPFNEEAVIEATHKSAIPVISAVGHETDTTLIDYVSDLRAPTPTAAAELAVPVRRDLYAQVIDDSQRLAGAMNRTLSHLDQRIQTCAAKLGDPQRLLEIRTQRLDHAIHKLDSYFERRLTRSQGRVTELAAMLRHPRQVIAEKSRTLHLWDQRVVTLKDRLLEKPEERLTRAGRMLEALSFHKVLERGYAVIRDSSGRPLTSAAAAAPCQSIDIEFRDGHKKGQIDG